MFRNINRTLLVTCYTLMEVLKLDSLMCIIVQGESSTGGIKFYALFDDSTI